MEVLGTLGGAAPTCMYRCGVPVPISSPLYKNLMELLPGGERSCRHM